MNAQLTKALMGSFRITKEPVMTNSAPISSIVVLMLVVGSVTVLAAGVYAKADANEAQASAKKENEDARATWYGHAHIHLQAD